METLRNFAKRPLRIGFVGALAALAISMTGCKENQVATVTADAETQAQIERIRGYRIFFGHQSVGDNIVAGIEDMKAGAGAEGFNVVAWKPGTPLPQGYFAHGYVGGNRSPQSKFDDFAKALDNELNGKVDVALMKLCYVDIHKDTDINALFENYAKTVEGLKARHPEVTIVHVTTPLMVKEGWSKLKYYAKTILGVENDNEKRNAFNRMMRERFRGEPIFDLEALQSTRPDGSKEAFGKDDRILGLAHAYTYDGGHLNELGRRLVAKELIAFLSALPVSNATQPAGPPPSL